MKILVSAALVAAIAGSIGTVAVNAKEHPAGYPTAVHRLHHGHAVAVLRGPGYFHPFASEPYLNVWGSHVYVDRPGY